MGFDFIADCVIHVSYDRRFVEAIDADDFTPPADAFALNVDLDDLVPYVDATVGTADNPRFIFDTGAVHTMIFSRFVAEHPDAIKSLGLENRIQTEYALLHQAEGVGGSFSFYPAAVQPFRVGPITFTRWLVDVSEAPPSFEGDDEGGLVGQDILQYFDVWFDYTHSTIYLVPNSFFKKMLQINR
jgi:hypothetical protein